MSDSKARLMAQLQAQAGQLADDRRFIRELLGALADEAGAPVDQFWPDCAEHVEPPEWYWRSVW